MLIHGISWKSSHIRPFEAESLSSQRDVNRLDEYRIDLCDQNGTIDRGDSHSRYDAVPDHDVTLRTPCLLHPSWQTEKRTILIMEEGQY